MWLLLMVIDSLTNGEPGSSMELGVVDTAVGVLGPFAGASRYRHCMSAVTQLTQRGLVSSHY